MNARGMMQTALLALLTAWGGALSSAQAQAPANDNFADAQALFGAAPLPGSLTLVGATSEVGEPAGFDTVWFTWTPPLSCRASFKVTPVGSPGSQANVTFYTGNSVGALTQVTQDASPNRSDLWADGDTGVTSGTQYYIRVSQRVAPSANYTFLLETYPLLLIKGVRTEAGFPVNMKLDIVTSSSAPVSADISDTKSPYTIIAPQGWSATIEASMDLRSITPPKRVYTNLMEHRRADDYLASQTPANNDFANAQEIVEDVTSGTLSGWTIAATSETDEPAPTGKSVWYKWTPPESCRVSFTVAPQNGVGAATKVTMFTGDAVDDLDQPFQNSRVNQTDFWADGGSDYYIRVQPDAGKTESPFKISWVTFDLILVEGFITDAGAPLNGTTLTLTGTPNPFFPPVMVGNKYTYIVHRGWSGQVVPSLAGHAFYPTLRKYTNLREHLSAENFISASPLTVNIAPPEAAEAGAQWRVDNGDWYNSGETTIGLANRSHVVSFKPVAGWEKPADQTVTIVANSAINTTGLYKRDPVIIGYISPLDQMTSVGQFRVDGGAWLNSGTSVTELALGNHEVSFRPRQGWLTPGSISRILGRNQTWEIPGNYMKQARSLDYGALQVDLQTTPSSIFIGKWRRVGTTPWLDSGYVEMGIPNGDYLVEFRDLAGFNKPSQVGVTIGDPFLKIITAKYTNVLAGSLQVLMTPEEAVTDGAKWTAVGMNTWLDTQDVIAGVPAGLYEIVFLPVQGYKAPLRKTVEVTPGGTTVISGNYTEAVPTGEDVNLTVDISPDDAVLSGALWRRAGTTTWLEDEEVEDNAPGGVQVIEFETIPGWITPDPIEVNVADPNPDEPGQTMVVNVTYRQKLGKLQVEIKSDNKGLDFLDAVVAGSKWRVKTMDDMFFSPWYNSGDAVDLPVGRLKLEYSDTLGWKEPAGRTVTIVQDGMLFISEVHEIELGSLMVNLLGEDAHGQFAAQDTLLWDRAQWRIESGTTTTDWMDSGVQLDGLPSGNIRIVYKDIWGWITPAPSNVQIPADDLLEIDAEYIRKVGQVRVRIQGDDAVTAGARWRLVGTSPLPPETGAGAPQWFTPNITVGDIPIEPYVVEFADIFVRGGIQGWATPDPVSIVVEWNEQEFVSVTYQRLMGSITTILQPDEAISLGAQWRVSGKQYGSQLGYPWLNTAETQMDVALGYNGITFSDVVGPGGQYWLPPATQEIILRRPSENVRAIATYSLTKPVPLTIMYSDKFTNTELQPTSATVGWSSFGANDPALGWADYDQAAGAYRAHIVPRDGYTRVSGVIENSANWLPYSSIGPNNYVRAKFFVYAGEQVASGTIPNMRLRVQARFAENSMLEVWNHLNADPHATSYSGDFAPSTNPARPSVYRVDIDPVDVPYLVQNPAVEGVQRAFEAFSIDPQDTGFLALTESVVGVYPVSALDPTIAPVKVFQAGDNLDIVAADGYIYVPGPEPYAFGGVDRSGVVPTWSINDTDGITIDSTTIPADKIGVAVVDLATDDLPANRLRVEQGKQYKIRFRLTSTQQANRQPQIRVRARTVKYNWTQKLEMGGAWAEGPQNNALAQQLLPGVGSLNPDNLNADSSVVANGGWYTMLFNGPMSLEIRPEFPFGTPLSTRMPNLGTEPGPGVNAPSMRDIMLGLDMLDSITTNGNQNLEQGRVTLDRVEVYSYDRVPD
ncbi:hypothetical protein CVU37_10530 [candidate division BRC1 bacterium HGW-BRC1-1]|nr:MAG: hypothetical protein CVU37_10530 [candidate division BRC1 bacterium HGW-BRC1-1]